MIWIKDKTRLHARPSTFQYEDRVAVEAGAVTELMDAGTCFPNQHPFFSTHSPSSSIISTNINPINIPTTPPRSTERAENCTPHKVRFFTFYDREKCTIAEAAREARVPRSTGSRWIKQRQDLGDEAYSVEGMAATTRFSFLQSPAALLPVGGVRVYKRYKRKHVASCRRHASSTHSFNSDFFTSFPDQHFTHTDGSRQHYSHGVRDPFVV